MKTYRHVASVCRSMIRHEELSSCSRLPGGSQRCEDWKRPSGDVGRESSDREVSECDEYPFSCPRAFREAKDTWRLLEL